MAATTPKTMPAAYCFAANDASNTTSVCTPAPSMQQRAWHQNPVCRTIRGTDKTTTSWFTLSLLFVLCALSPHGCAEPGIAEPTWVDDVRPIMVGNCVRCHTTPAIGGAPTAFRLDTYADTTLPNGTVVSGALTMGEYIIQRAAIDEDMPPDFPLSDGQRTTLRNWFDVSQGRFFNLGERGNTAPAITLMSAIPTTADRDAIIMEYEITDSDGDLVSGVLIAQRDGGDDIVVDAGFRSGRGSVRWDPATQPPGNYTLAARLSDDLESIDVELGQIAVMRSGNSLPTVVIETPAKDTLIGPRQSPFSISIAATDADGDPLTATFEAVRGSQIVSIATNVAVDDTGGAAAAWDVSGLDDAPTWRVRVTVTDGSESTVVTSDRVIVSNVTTALTFDDIAQSFSTHCGVCHPNRAINNIPHDFNRFESTDATLGVDELKGLIYRRVVLERTMPPPSADGLLGTDGPLMSEQDRAQMAEYLLGGAPPSAP